MSSGVALFPGIRVCAPSCTESMHVHVHARVLHAHWVWQMRFRYTLKRGRQPASLDMELEGVSLMPVFKRVRLAASFQSVPEAHPPRVGVHDPCDQPDYQMRAMGTHWTPPPPPHTSPPITTPNIHIYVARLRFYTFTDLPPFLPHPAADLETRICESSYRRRTHEMAL